MTPNVTVLCERVICVFVSREHHMDYRLCHFLSPLYALHCFIWGKTQCFLTWVVCMVSRRFFLPIRGHWLPKKVLELGAGGHIWPLSFLLGWFNAFSSLCYCLSTLARVTSSRIEMPYENAPVKSVLWIYLVSPLNWCLKVMSGYWFVVFSGNLLPGLGKEIPRHHKHVFLSQRLRS